MNNNYLFTKPLGYFTRRMHLQIAKLTVFFFVTLFLYTPIQAQIPADHTLSVGFSYGVNKVTGTKMAFGKNRITPMQIQADARYLFNDLFGLSGHYAYSGFSQTNGAAANGFHRVVLEGIVNLNIAEAFNIYDFDLYLHAGGGPSLSSLKKDKMFVVMGGLTPEYRINNKLAIKGDLSYVHKMKQNFDFAGVYLGEKNGRAINESSNVMNYSIGLQYYIGTDNRRSGRYFY